MLDLGCGPGQFGELCVKAGHHYRGLDYSKAAVDLGREKGFGDYRQVDLEEDMSIIKAGRYRTATGIEFMEHVHRDVEILAAVPSGRKIIISGPSYAAPGHVRFFKTFNDFTERYQHLLRLEKSYIVTCTNNGNKEYIYVIVARRR